MKWEKRFFSVFLFSLFFLFVSFCDIFVTFCDIFATFCDIPTISDEFRLSFSRARRTAELRRFVSKHSAKSSPVGRSVAGRSSVGRPDGGMAHSRLRWDRDGGSRESRFYRLLISIHGRIKANQLSTRRVDTISSDETKCCQPFETKCC